MKSIHRLAQLVAVFGTAMFICSAPALAQECPEFVGSLDLGCTALDVALSPGYALVACDWEGLVVVDVSDPSLPVVVGEELLERAQHVAVIGEHAYVVRHSPTNMIPHGFNVVDIGTPDDPVWTGWLSLGWTDAPGVVTTTENHAYVALGDEVLMIDVSDPFNPAPAGTLYVASSGDVQDIALAGDYAYVLYEGGMYVFDVNDPSQPVVLGNHSAEAYCRFLHVALDLTGNAYVTEYCSDGSHPPGSSLTVVDVSNPQQPIPVGGIGDWILQLHDVAVSGGYAYVTDPWRDQLRVIAVSNPRQPAWAGAGETLGSAEDVAVGWGYVYVADGDAGLTIFRECGPFSDGFESGDTSAWSATVP